MALKSPELKSPPALLCDWLEMKVLSEPHGSFRLGNLKRYWDISREIESSDPEGKSVREEDTDTEGVAGPDEEIFIDSLIEEISDRRGALGDAYPFTLDGRNKLIVVEPSGAGGYMYLFCLLLTYSNGHEIFSGEWLPEILPRTRDLFQACSTLAAAGEIRGCSISFGWPRPNSNPPFLTKLREVYALFGEGEVVASPRRGVSACPKDEEIDIIAWRPRRDRAPGTEYLLGQVASGDNWMSKPLEGKPIENFHRNWFSQAPASHARGFIFIPHAVPPVGFDGTRKERINAITTRYGTIIDRLRLPLLTQQGIEIATDNPGLIIERQHDIPEIREWVIGQINSLHQF